MRNGVLSVSAYRWFTDRRFVLMVVLLATISLATSVRVAFGPHIREDAYITLVYAMRLGAGQGFVFNPGEHVLGTTTPLYTLLLAGLAWLGVDPAASAVSLGVISDAAAMVVLGLIAARFLQPMSVFFILLTYALLSPTVAYAVSGMETPFYMLLILSSVLAYARGKIRLAGALCALVVLTRPDGAILAGVILFHALYSRRAGVVSAVAVFAIVIAPWTLFAWAYFGSPIPQSVMTKSLYSPEDPWLSARNFGGYFVERGTRGFLPLVPVFIFGLLRLKRDSSAVVLMVWATAYSAAFIVSNKFLYPHLPFEWYFVPLLTPFALGVGHGMEGIPSYLARLAGQKARRLRFALAIPLALAFLAGYGSLVREEHVGLGTLIGGREEAYANLAQRVVNMGIRDELVAAYEIGAFAYNYRGPILDLSGLVSPQVLGRDSYEVLYESRPPWLMSYLDMLPRKLADEAWFRQEYKRIYAVGTWEGRIAALFRRYPPANESVPSGPQNVLGGSMQLVGLEIQRKQLSEEQDSLHATLVWKALLKIDKHYTIYVHLRDPSDRLLAQHDGEPQGNEHPTTKWQVGEIVVDKHDLVVDKRSLEAGCCLVVGAYETGAVERLQQWTDPSGSPLGHDLRFPLSSLDLQR